MLSIFGPITNPLPNYGELTDPNMGLISFLSNLIRLAIVGAGLFAFINLILAGFQYIGSGGDVKATGAALNRINMSLVGLVVIVASFAIAGVIGLLLFGDASAILSPTIYGPGTE